MKQLSPLTKTRRYRPVVEELEFRLVLSGWEPTAVEQLLLEQLNDARANPAAYGASIGLNLSNVAPSQPLAFDTRLIEAARRHSLDMSNRNFFAHTNPSQKNPGDRISAEGYPWNSYGESIAAGFGSTEAALKALIIDAGIANLGHRRHLLAIDAYFKSQNQVGIGIVQNGSGYYRNYFTIDTASTSDTRPFITGVVFQDHNGNTKYDIGEGLGNVTVTVSGVGSVQTFNTGGYSVRVNPGTYTVTASGGNLTAPISFVVTVGSQNRRLNFIAGAIPAPVLQAPSGSVVSLQPTFNWDDVADATSYEIWVDDLTTGQSKALYATGITQSQWTANVALTVGHTYRWWVRAHGEGISPWSTYKDLTISPAAPAPISPTNSLSTLQPTFQWGGVSWANTYEIWVDDLTTRQSAVIRVSGLTTTSYTHTTALKLGHSYRWWVRAADGNGGGVWSTHQDFSVSMPGPALQGSEGSANVFRPTFSWNSVWYAKNYEIWIDDLTTRKSAVIRANGIDATSYTPTKSLVPGHTYRWWVRGVDQNGNGAWSAHKDFTLSVPTPAALSQGALNSVRPTLTWNGVAWAKSYEIWIDDLTTRQSRIIHVTDLRSTFYTMLSALTPGHTYRWWVRGVDQNRDGVWSSFQDLTVSVPAPTLQTPQGSLNQLHPTLTWTGVSWADSYEVWIDDQTTRQSRIVHATNLNSTFYSISAALKPGHTYRWWVRAVSDGVGLWSTFKDFTITLSGPVLVGPAHSLTDTTPIFQWNNVSWAKSYALWIDDLTTGQSKVHYTANINSNYWIADTNLIRGHRYRWWVQAVGDNGAAVWSDYLDFTIA